MSASSVSWAQFWQLFFLLTDCYRRFVALGFDERSLRLADVVFDRDFPNHQQQLQCKGFHAKYLCSVVIMVVMGVSESREGLLSVAWVLLALTNPYHPISSIYCMFIYMRLSFMINLGDFPIHEMDMNVWLYDPIPKSSALGFPHPPGWIIVYYSDLTPQRPLLRREIFPRKRGFLRSYWLCFIQFT